MALPRAPGPEKEDPWFMDSLDEEPAWLLEFEAAECASSHSQKHAGEASGQLQSLLPHSLQPPIGGQQDASSRERSGPSSKGGSAQGSRVSSATRSRVSSATQRRHRRRILIFCQGLV